jgi:tetratricopeptide (TPR) repeat protein
MKKILKSAGAYLLISGIFMVAVLLGASSSAAEESAYAKAYQAGQDLEKGGKFTEARDEFEKALAVAGITSDQIGQALFKIGACLINEKKVQEGVASIQKARAMKEISTQTRIQANILFGQTYLAYPWTLDQARDAFAQSLELPEITAEQKTAAHKGLVKAFMGLRKFAEARAVMIKLMADFSLTPAEKLATQIAIGKTLVLDGKYPEARTELTQALAMEGVSDANKADIQLQIGISYCGEKDFERAKPELQKVLTMPGAVTAPPIREDGMGSYIPSIPRETKLRLQKMEPSDEKEKVITVLFIGSSMTIRGYMFQVVENLAASAPAGRPRIMSGLYGRGGTGIEVFWADGETGDTARGKIASMPWDAVVLETSILRSAESNLKYAKLFCDLLRSRNIRPVVYESQVKQDAVYPAAHQKFHEDELLLAKTAQSHMAPVVLAQMHYLAATPNAQVGIFYDDWIHPSEKSIYLAAYCIYSTITGYSPVGLLHPKSISDEDAKALQEAAWKAVQEVNPDLKPWN